MNKHDIIFAILLILGLFIGCVAVISLIQSIFVALLFALQNPLVSLLGMGLISIAVGIIANALKS